MSSLVPAFRGKFGSTEFYIVTMPAAELVSTLKIPKEIEGWEDLSVDEKWQRDINYKRVAGHIAPYLAEDPDRFIGSFIVSAHHHEEMFFESLSDVGVKFPKLLPGKAADSFGLLKMSGTEMLVPLDGQHRLAGLKFAMEGKDNAGRPLPSQNSDVAKDDCTLIIIRNEPMKARKIFNKVNRYAKPTSKADNLITADDDYIAVIVRDHIVGGILGVGRVNTANTLPSSGPNSRYFTTLSTLYTISLKYEELMIGKKPIIVRLPSQQDIRLAERNLKEFWEEFLTIGPYESSLVKASTSDENRVAEIRNQKLICKPVVMIALAEAIMAILACEKPGGGKYALKTLCKYADTVDWSSGNPLWKGVLIDAGGKVITNSVRNLASRVIAYLLGQPLEKKELEKLQDSHEKNFERPLPPRSFQP